MKPRNTSLQTEGFRAHVTLDNVEMFEVVRHLRSNGERFGEVIPITDIWRPVDLIPQFGNKCPEDWTCYTAVEEATAFLVNSFWDKETYQSVF